MNKIKLTYSKYGYITNINIIMCFINTTDNGNKLLIYNKVLNKDKIDMKLCHHTYIWNDIKKEYEAEETDETKIDFLINKIHITKTCKNCKTKNCKKDCQMYISLINYKNPITKNQKNVLVDTHEIIENKLIRDKIPEGKYETNSSKSDFIESIDKGNKIKLNFEVENDLNNNDIKTINFFFGKIDGSNNFIFYWSNDKKMYISKNNICILIIANINGKFILNSTIFNGIVKNFKNLEIRKSYERIKFDTDGHYKIRFDNKEGMLNFLFKSEDKGFNLIFKNTPIGGGSKYFIWNSNKKMYTNDKFLLTFNKLDNNKIKARLNNVSSKELTLDNGTIVQSNESIFLEDGIYNVQNDITKSIIVKKGKFDAKINLDNKRNTYEYNYALKGYTTSDTNTDKFIIFNKEGNRIKLLRYHSSLTKEEPLYIVKSNPVYNYYNIIILLRIIVLSIIIIGIYLIYIKVTIGYIEIKNEFLNLNFII